MVPNLRSSPICFCGVAEAVARSGKGIFVIGSAFAGLYRTIVDAERVLLEQGRMIECKTHALNTLLDIDYSEVEKRITALLSSKTRLSNDEFYSILQPLPPMQSGRTAEDYKRKPWLKLQDDYDRQKSRRNGRPKKGKK